MPPGELYSSEAFECICWSLFILFFICPPCALNCHQQKYGLYCAPLRLLWVKIAAGWGCYDLAGCCLCCNHDGLHQQHWKEPFGNSSSSIQAAAKQMLVWLIWMMDESIPDRRLVEFVCINAVNMWIFDLHKETVSSSLGVICSTLMWLFLILFWITEVEHEGVMHSNEFMLCNM